MDALYPQIMKFDPTRRPDWRWERAQALIEWRRRPKPKNDDFWTIRAHAYLSSTVKKANLPSSDFDCIDLARRIHEAEGGELRLSLETRLLAGMTVEEIAAGTQLTTELVQCYESLFFDVSGHLNVRDWILAKAVGYDPLEPQEVVPLDVVVRMLAYYAGPVSVESLLHAASELRMASKDRLLAPLAQKLRQLQIVWVPSGCDGHLWLAIKATMDCNDLAARNSHLKRTLMASLQAWIATATANSEAHSLPATADLGDQDASEAPAEQNQPTAANQDAQSDAFDGADLLDQHAA